MKIMYTPLKLGKKLRQLTETRTVLGTAVSAMLNGLRQEDLLELIVAYTNWDGTDSTRIVVYLDGNNAPSMPRLPELAELLLRALGEIHIQGEPTDQQNEIIERASKELRKSHRQFRAAMTWLCSSKDSDSAESTSLKLLAAGKAKPGRYPLVDKKSENFIRYFEVHGLKHFKSELSLQNSRLLPVPRIVHYVDAFCACILDRCLGRKVSEMPVKICPTCRELFLSERKRFCSMDCQWKHHWTPERRADDKWVKDLEKFSKVCEPKYRRSIVDLRKRLALPKVMQRLESIKKKIEKKDWVGWARIAQRIEAIEDVAAKSELRN